jgi:DNA invertase Pin-like site-specific DNA recombinase
MQDRPYLALGYLRVSSQEQAQSGLGLAAQQAAIEAEAKRRGWHDVRWIEDPGYSGKTTVRPGLMLARELLHRGEADGLIVARMDRLSRSLLDFTGILADASVEGWDLIAVDNPIDPTTPVGEAMVSVAAVFAQLERRMISERTKAALAVKKAQGVKLGRPRTTQSDVIARIEHERQAGRLLREIAAGLNDDGVPTAQGGVQWYPSTVRGVIRRAAS